MRYAAGELGRWAAVLASVSILQNSYLLFLGGLSQLHSSPDQAIERTSPRVWNECLQANVQALRFV